MANFKYETLYYMCTLIADVGNNIDQKIQCLYSCFWCVLNGISLKFTRFEAIWAILSAHNIEWLCVRFSAINAKANFVWHCKTERPCCFLFTSKWFIQLALECRKARNMLHLSINVKKCQVKMWRTSSNGITALDIYTT